MTKRKAIGRTLPASLDSIDEAEQIFMLQSGLKATFKPLTIAADEVEQRTYVILETNGRDQQALTQASVADISRTITQQQFFPAIGRMVADKIEILDGSRRRAAAIYANVGLKLLVTEDDISIDDARQLAADIQTAREHNLREVGLRLLLLRQSGMSQKDIAKQQKMSEAKVTRALQAASVPEHMLALIPDQAEITYPDYKTLLEINKSLTDKGLSLDSLVKAVSHDIANMDDSLVLEEMKIFVINSYKNNINLIVAKPSKDKAVVESIYRFSNKNQFARKRSKERQVSFEFSQMPKSLVDELEAMIKSKVAEHFE